LLVGLDLGLADRLETGGAQEALDRAVGGADARTLLLLPDVRLAHGNALHRERQPPRRRERLGALVGEPSRDQAGGDELAQIVRRARLHARGDFLGEQLEQEVGHNGRQVAGAAGIVKSKSAGFWPCFWGTRSSRTLPAGAPIPRHPMQALHRARWL